MKYEISELAELITNFVCEGNTETERENGRDAFIIILAGSGRNIIIRKIFNDTEV